MGNPKTRGVMKTKSGKKIARTSKVAKIGSHRKLRTNDEGMVTNKNRQMNIENVSSSQTMVTPVTAKSDTEAINRAFVRKSHSSFATPSAQKKGQPTNKENMSAGSQTSVARGHVPHSIVLPESTTVQTPSELETITPSERWGANVQDPSHDKARTLRELETFVKSVMFKALKFITSEEELEYSQKANSLCSYVCNNLHITTTYRYDFWKDHKARIGEKLNKKRTDVNSAMKQEYISCFLREEFFNHSEILLMRQNKEYCYYNNFLKHLVKCVVGKREFSRLSHHQQLHKYCSISDEACAHLFYENNDLKWKDMATSGNHKYSEVVPKYTNGGNSTGPNATSRRFGGWSDNAYNRYNELYFKIEQDRASALGRLFDEQFQQHMLHDFQEKRKNSKKNSKLSGALAVAKRAPVVLRHSLFPNSNIQGMARPDENKSYGAVANGSDEDDSSTSDGEEVETEDENAEDNESLGHQAVPLTVSSITNVTAI